MYFTVMESNDFFSIMVFFNSVFHYCESFLQYQNKKLYFLLFINKRSFIFFIYCLWGLDLFLVLNRK